MSLSSINGAELNDSLTDNQNEDISLENTDFKELAGEINDSSQCKEIKLTHDYIFNPSNDEEYIDGIDIEIDNFIIDGHGHKINGNKQARIFNIKSDNVVLKNITLINGFSSEHGGSIYWTGENGTITDSNFKDSYTSRYGGAVSFKWDGTVENSNFENNKAGTGGALDFGGKAKIYNSTFKNNIATFQGGAMSLFGISTINNSIFKENIGGDGGGILSEGKTIVYNSTFILNHAIGYGGGIYFSTYGYVQNSIFTQNTAEIQGGAILTKSNTQDIYNSTFNHNDAKEGKSLFLIADSIKLENLIFNSANSSFAYEIHNESKKFIFLNLSFNNVSKTNSNPQKNSSASQIIQTTIKKETTIKAKSKSFKAGKKSKKYTIVLKSGKTQISGKKIRITIKGKNYISRTNQKGKAIFKLKLYKKGKYKAKISFNGDFEYKSSKKNIIIKIK